MRIYTLLLLIAFNSILHSQQRNIFGAVKDSADGKNLIGANVIITNLSDSAAKGAATDRNGSFKIENVSPGNYLLTISFIGYNSFKQKFEMENRSIDFGTIQISRASVETPEVEVVAKVPPVVIKDDTTEFNAGAFKTNKDATSEDFIQKLPGVTVQDGKVQAQGEEVKKVLVDGKQYFGDDPMAVLKNIPAEVIERIQIFDQMSDQSQFTGFDDGNTSKTINIITRLRITDGTFGKLFSGYGEDERYKLGGNINYFNQDQRISILAQSNNISEQNFSNEDLLGVLSAGNRRNRGGGGRGGRGGFGGGGGFFSGMRGGGNASEFLVNARDGVTKTYAFGSNFIDKITPEFEFNGSYFYNLTNQNAESNTLRQYLLAQNIGQIYDELDNSVSDNLNHRLNMRLEYNFDTLTSVMLRPRLTIQQNDGTNFSDGKTLKNNSLLNSTMNNLKTDYSALNTSADLLFRKRFETRGRTLSFFMNGVINNSDGENDFYSENLFYAAAATGDTINQNSDLVSRGFSLGSNLTYTEPLGENGMMQLTYRYNYSEDESDKNTFNINSSSISTLDSSLSNVYDKIYVTNTAAAGYLWRMESTFISFNLAYNIAELRNDQSFPNHNFVTRKFYSLLPFAMFSYGFSRTQNLRVFYRTFNNAPSVQQLQNVLDNSNPLQLSTGNPSLAQDTRHTVSANYSSVDIFSQQSFFVMLSSTMTSDYIGNSVFIANNDTVINNVALRNGVQLTTPINLDGYFNFRTNITYGFPIAWMKSNLNLNLTTSFSTAPGKINNVDNESKNNSFGFGAVAASNISKELDFTLSSNVAFNTIKNSIQTSFDDEYYNLNSSLKFFYLFWEGIVFQTELNHKYDSGLSDEYNQNALIWNVSIGKKLFKDDVGEIRITAYDILNQNTNIKRNVTDTYYEDTRSNILRSYLMLSFTYNIRAF